MTNLLNDLLNANIEAIVALENKKDRKVYLFNTKNLGLYLAQLSDKIKNKRAPKNVPFKKLKLVILETNSSDKWSLTYWTDKYRSGGWEFYNRPRAMSLTIQTRVTTQGVFVELRNKGYRSFVIGLFSTVVEAEEWIRTEYRLGISGPVYATNDLTKSYFNS